MSPCCCSRDTGAQAGWGAQQSCALPGLPRSWHELVLQPLGTASQAAPHTPVQPQPPNWAHWEHSCPHPQNRAPRTGIKAIRVGGHEPPWCHPHAGSEAEEGSRGGVGNHPRSLWLHPKPQLCLVQVLCHLRVALVTPGDTWVALPPPVSLGWLSRGPWVDPDPSPQDEELRVRGISPQLAGWKLLPPKPGRSFGEHPKG